MQYQKILLIDDDEEDHEIFMTALSHISGDFQCTTSADARDALGKLQSKEISPDVIFLDLNMPIMSGQEFLSEIKKNELIQDIPVIVFSTSANPATVQKAKELGAIDFLTKPDRLDKLVNILKPVLM